MQNGYQAGWRQHVSAALVILVVGLGVSGCAPAEPPPPTVSISEAEAQQNYDEQAEGQWEAVVAKYPEAQRPDIESYSPASPNERPEQLADCLRQAGYPDAEAFPDGSVGVSPGPDDQELLYLISSYTCYASIPFEAVYNTPPNDSQIEWLYHYFTRELADCIDSQGYAIPNNAPSFSQFREAMTGNGSEYWSPYVELPTLTPAETQTLRDVCVEYPDEYYGR
ncbi:MAG: hypothetical protein ACTJGQ_02500 [Agrococcus casei]